MKCSICNKEIILVPSAAERAAKYGKPASYYTTQQNFSERVQ